MTPKLTYNPWKRGEAEEESRNQRSTITKDLIKDVQNESNTRPQAICIFPKLVKREAINTITKLSEAWKVGDEKRFTKGYPPFPAVSGISYSSMFRWSLDSPRVKNEMFWSRH